MVDEKQEIIIPDVTTIQQITKAEIDIQISTAKQYPRSIQKFRQEATSMATIDEEVAASCFYKLMRKNKDGTQGIIEGPSVRLAEIVASCWGNLRFGARIIQETDKEVIAQGVAHDLEKNVSNTIEVSRRITNKNDKRYSADMIQVTKNAACSIALRNAIFKTVPFTYAKAIYEKAKQTAIGNAETLNARRQKMIGAFAKMDVSLDKILKALKKPSIEDIGLTEIELLLGMYNAIKDGDTTVDEQFNSDEITKANVQMPKSKQQAQKSSQEKKDATKIQPDSENNNIEKIQKEFFPEGKDA